MIKATGLAKGKGVIVCDTPEEAAAAATWVARHEFGVPEADLPAAVELEIAETEPGIQGDRVLTISYGEELPVCHDETSSCWERNRRVHFVILGQ